MLAYILHLILTTIFGIYIRGRKLYHTLFDRIASVLNYHHRTPESTSPIIHTPQPCIATTNNQQ